MASSKLPLYAGLVANTLIAITKFIAAIATGSSAMVSEGIHSVVDTLNEILLLFGLKKSKKKADKTRPFGYGKELYFWSFIVSILIFGFGAGVAFYEGITHLQHPRPIENPLWNYIVLAVAVLFDGISFIIALKNFNKHRGDQSFWKAVKKSKDPTTFVVLFEDAADVIGLVVAFLGVYLGHVYNNPYIDGIASMVIGVILTAISLVLTRESWSLLMGETISPEVLERIIVIVEENKAVEKMRNPMSMFLSPEEALLILKPKVKKNLSATELVEAIKAMRNSIRHEFPKIKQVFIEPV